MDRGLHDAPAAGAPEALPSVETLLNARDFRARLEEARRARASAQSPAPGDAQAGSAAGEAKTDGLLRSSKPWEDRDPAEVIRRRAAEREAARASGEPASDDGQQAAALRLEMALRTKAALRARTLDAPVPNVPAPGGDNRDPAADRPRSVSVQPGAAPPTPAPSRDSGARPSTAIALVPQSPVPAPVAGRPERRVLPRALLVAGAFAGGLGVGLGATVLAPLVLRGLAPGAQETLATPPPAIAPAGATAPAVAPVAEPARSVAPVVAAPVTAPPAAAETVATAPAVAPVAEPARSVAPVVAAPVTAPLAAVETVAAAVRPVVRPRIETDMAAALMREVPTAPAASLRSDPPGPAAAPSTPRAAMPLSGPPAPEPAPVAIGDVVALPLALPPPPPVTGIVADTAPTVPSPAALPAVGPPASLSAVASADPGPTPAGPPPAPPPAAGVQVSVLAAASAGTGKAEAVARQIGAAGFKVVRTREVALRIIRTHVRYYHPQDAEAAAALAATMKAEARDFTSAKSPPPVGSVELWIAGAAEPDAAKTKTKARTTTAKKPSAAATEQARQQAELNRLRDRLVQQLRALPGP
ncbi:MAG: hypothetical protein ACOY5U_15555 [Pseudomonadota bacterium]